MNRLGLCLIVNLAMAMVAPAVHAGDQVTAFVRSDYRKLPQTECAKLAVEAMGAAAKFPYAEVKKDGSVEGWDADVAIKVMFFPAPEPDRVYFVAAACGAGGPETNRVLQSVADYLLKKPANPEAAERIVPLDGKIPPRPFTLTCQSEEQSAIPLLKHFNSAAMIILEKKGYQAGVVGKNFVGGYLPGNGEPDRTVLMFLAPANRTTAVRFHIVYGVAGEESAESSAKELQAQIVTLLYE